MKKLFNQLPAWMEGKLTIPYNLKWLVFILLLPFCALFWLWKKLSWLIEKLLTAIVFLWNKFSAWAVTFWQKLKALWAKNSTSTLSGSAKQSWGPWLILLLILALLIFGLFRYCKHSDSPVETFVENALQNDTLYYESFDDAVIASAYLNGVQNSVTQNRKWAVGLVGIKFVNGKSITKYQWDANTTYAEAVRIIADEWRPVLTKNLNPNVTLNKDQLTAVLLAAMRMGPKRFAWSSLCLKLNEGNYDEAAEYFVLENKNRVPLIISGEEPLQYMKVLRFMYEGGVSARELIDFPILGYRDNQNKLNPRQTYTKEEMLKILSTGNNQTPRQRLGL